MFPNSLIVKFTNAFEGITSGIQNINTDHGAIHMGYGMVGNIYLASLAPSATKNYRFKGPSTLYAHIKDLTVTGQGAPLRVDIIKDATITGVGTEITGAIQNANHNSTITPESELYDGTVTYTGGTIWDFVVIPGSSSAVSTSSGEMTENPNLERVTKSGDEDYIIKLTNLDGTDTCSHIQISMFFYEEPQGEV